MASERPNFYIATPFDTRINAPRGLSQVLPILREPMAIDRDMDMKDPLSLQRSRQLADFLIEHCSSPDISKIEKAIYANEKTKQETGAMTHLAVKLARSKLALKDIKEPTHVTYVVPMYGELNRMKVRGEESESGEHPHGEDFIRQKHEQLNWLHSANPLVTYDIRLVDDGCDQGSGTVAATHIDEHDLEPFSVLHLKDALHERTDQHDLVQQALRSLDTTQQSMKAGALFYGAAEAIATRKQQSQEGRHVIVFTDADLSIDLGQSGLVIQPIAAGESQLAAGSRREQLSYSDKPVDRNNRGKALIYLKELAVPGVFPLDTQCPLKGFDAAHLEDLMNEGLNEYTFTYDLEIFAKTADKEDASVKEVALAHFDSVAESTAIPSAYLDINALVASMSKKRKKQLDRDSTAFGFAKRARKLLRKVSKNTETYARFLSALPNSITQPEPYTENFFDPQKLDELEAAFAEHTEDN